METTMRICCQIPVETDSWNVFRWLRHIFRHAVTVIMSGREAHARRIIQLYFDDRLIDEFAKAGKRIAKKDVDD